MKMRRKQPYNKLIPVLLACILGYTSCEKALEEKTYDKFSSSTFYLNAEDVKAAVTGMYGGMLNRGHYGGGWGGANEGWVAQSSFMTDELVCSWGWDGWRKFNQLNFSEDFSQLLNHYNGLMPMVSEITLNLEKIPTVKMDETLRNRYLAELKALRAHYSWILYNFYGPVPIRIDAKEASNPAAAPIPRPDKQWMVAQIEKDYKEALAVLPKASELAAADYGRFTKDACLMGLIKLYMHEKNWKETINQFNVLKTYGHDLQKNYADIFKYSNKGNTLEVLLAIPCRFDADNSNLWLAMCMPGNYVDPGGLSITQWGGYKMPWKTYDRFDQNDKRLSVLLAKWPTNGGATFDARANNYIGAIPMKYGPDPGAISETQGTDIVVWRYADAMLLAAEAINEDQGPVQEAYNLLNAVRTRAGVPTYTLGQFDKDAFRKKLMDERLFELWCEGARREDMIRWGTFIQRAKDEGSVFTKPGYVLHPLPRKVINETKGVVKQNEDY
ncbi:RagB/SusD family nutrient uptake outer membrane protein [Chitinophaga lutea]|uniref:RagB/SusD family nutrient uptake outer membrane protein n=2 Tax=Chitinophaga lutea TaxID=2488634 RepID=A0A3N4PVX8_9BACT|nr:RagB/SusD family nutrient uptake outer membrane protein [Chitinophaga lutea]